MPVSVVQEKAGPSALNGAAASVTLSAAPVVAVGRYLIAMFHSPSADAVPQWAAAGFTQFAGAAADDAGRYTGFGFRKVATGDGVTWTMSAENADPAIETETSELHVWEVAGLDEAALLHAVKVGVAGSYTSIQPGGIAITAADGGIVFTAAGLGGPTGGGETITNDFTSPAAGSALHTRSVTGYRILTGAVSDLNPFIGWTTSRRANALSVALKAVPAAAPATATPSYIVNVMVGTALVSHEMNY